MLDHPFQEDLSQLKDSDIDQKLQEVTSKYFIARRLGNQQLLTQLEIFVNIYKEEQSRRYRNRFKKDTDGDLDQLINVDRN
jgi:hypothetical protein